MRDDMNQLRGAVGELRATVHVTRKATGKVETYELVGGLNLEQLEAVKQAGIPKHHGSSGAMVGPEGEITTKGK